MSKQKRPGYTLVEILVAIAIFSIGILSLFAAFSLALRIAQHARESSTATYIAQEKIEKLRQQGFGSIATTTTPTVETTSELPNGFSKTTVSLYQGNEKAKHIIVAVYWKNRPESRAITLQTIIGQGGISD